MLFLLTTPVENLASSRAQHLSRLLPLALGYGVAEVGAMNEPLKVTGTCQLLLYKYAYGYGA